MKKLYDKILDESKSVLDGITEVTLGTSVFYMANEIFPKIMSREWINAPNLYDAMELLSLMSVYPISSGLASIGEGICDLLYLNKTERMGR